MKPWRASWGSGTAIDPRNGTRGVPTPDLFIILVRLGRFWCHFESEPIPKGMSKSHLFITNQYKMLKDEVREGGLEKHCFGMDFGCQNGRPWMVRTELSLDTCSKIRGSGASPRGTEKGGEMASTNHQNRPSGRPGGLTFAFLMAFGRGEFVDGFPGGKKTTKTGAGAAPGPRVVRN